MITIKNSKELAELVDDNKDLILDEDIRIEFEPTREELRDVECHHLYMENDEQKFDFNGRDFNGRDFNGRDFNSRNFNGRDFNSRNFNGRDFNGWDFNGYNFNGKKISYYAFFNCYGSIKCESIEGRRTPHAKPVCLDGKLEIVKSEDEDVLNAIKLLEEKGKLKDGKILLTNNQ